MDDVSQLWSWALAAVGVSGLYLTTKKLAIGFAVGVAVQGLWIAFALVSGQLGFIASALAFGWVNALGWYRWTRNEQKPKSDLSWGKGEKTRVYGTARRLPPPNLDLIDLNAPGGREVMKRLQKEQES